MSISNEVATQIVSLGLGTGVGTDIFIGSKTAVPSGPADVGPYISLVDTGGTGAMLSHSSRYPRPSCQVSVRARMGTVAKAKAEALLAALGDQFNVTWGSRGYLTVRAVQEVTDMPADSVGRPRFGFNLQTLTKA